MYIKARDAKLAPELCKAAENMQWVIEGLGARQNNGDFGSNWRDYLEPILVDAYIELDKALELHRP